MLTVLAGDAGDERAGHGSVSLVGRSLDSTGRGSRVTASRPWASDSLGPRCPLSGRVRHRAAARRRRPASASPSRRMHDALLSAATTCACDDYVLSLPRRARTGDARRLPLPAALAHRRGRAPTRPRVDRWLAGAEVVHGTNYVVPPSRLPTRRVRVRLLVPAPPRATRDPDVRRAGDGARAAAVGRGAVVHTSSQATEADRAASCSPGPPVAHRPPRPAPAARAAADATRSPSSSAAVRARHRHARATQEPADARARVRPRWPAQHPDAAPRARRRRRRRLPRGPHAPSTRSARHCRRVLLTGRVDDGDAVLAAAPRRGARLPVARRGLRLPAARRDAGRHARGGQHRRLDPGGRRRRRAAVRPATTSTRSRGARRGARPTTTMRAAPVAAGARRAGSSSPGSTVPPSWSTCTVSSLRGDAGQDCR